MSVLYIFKMNDPNNVGIFPPSIFASEWVRKLNTYFDNNNITPARIGTSRIDILEFNDLTALNSWLAEYTLTDASLISDLNTWKSTHGVSFQSYYFDTNNEIPIVGPLS